MESIEDLIYIIERDLEQDNLNGITQNCQKALQLVESTGVLKGKGIIYQKLSVIHFSVGNRNKALQLLEEAANIYNKGNFKDLLALCLHDMAIVHTNFGNLENALKLYKEAYNIMNNIGMGQHPFAFKIQGKNMAFNMQLGGDKTILDEFRKLNQP